MKTNYFIVIDNLDRPQMKWSGFLVKFEAGGRSKGDREKAREVIEDLWMEGKLPQNCFVNGFSEENIIMPRPKKEADRELLPIEEAGNRLIDLIELVSVKAQAQQQYSTIASMVEKIFTGKESELTPEEIQQAQDSKTVKNIISSLTRSIADVELCRQHCTEHTELILGIIQMGKDGNYAVHSSEELMEEIEESTSSDSQNNHSKSTPKTTSKSK